MPTPMPMVQEICREFVLDFKRREIETKSAKLIHDGAWKESKEDIKCVVKEILNVLKDIWNNSAFDPELAKTLNEGTYQSTVTVPVIQASLKISLSEMLFLLVRRKSKVLQVLIEREKVTWEDVQILCLQ